MRVSGAAQARDFLGAGWAFPVTLEAGDIATAAYEEDVRQAIFIIPRTEPERADHAPGFRRRAPGRSPSSR